MLVAYNVFKGHSYVLFGEGALQIFAHFILLLKLFLHFYLFYVCAFVQASAWTHMYMS